MNLNAYLTGSITIVHCPGDSIYFSHCLLRDNIDKYLFQFGRLVPSPQRNRKEFNPSSLLASRHTADGVQYFSNEFVDIQFGELQLVRNGAEARSRVTNVSNVRFT